MSKLFTESVIRVLVFWIVVRVYNKWYQELWFESLKEARFDSVKVVLVFVFSGRSGKIFCLGYQVRRQQKVIVSGSWAVTKQQGYRL